MDILPEFKALGFCFLADPHFAATPPGKRLEGYFEQITEKVRFGLEFAREQNLLPVILGDLFHWPRDNPNWLLVMLIELLRPFKPWVLVGNHDKYQARYTEDVSLAVLDAAGAIRLISEPGPQFKLRASGPQGEVEVVLGASPDMDPIPRVYQKTGQEIVVWVTHHNIGFPDYEDKPLRLREIPGVDFVFNGHIHRPQEMQVRGGTRWVNVGSLARTQFYQWVSERKPALGVWKPGMEDIQRIEVPYLSFDQVFPDEQPPPEEPEAGESGFLTGLERLAGRRTREGVGLKQFLEANLNLEQAEYSLIWELYKEVVNDPQRDS